MSRKRDNWIYRHRLKWGENWHDATLLIWRHHRERLEPPLVKPIMHAKFKKRKGK